MMQMLAAADGPVGLVGLVGLVGFAGPEAHVAKPSGSHQLLDGPLLTSGPRAPMSSGPRAPIIEPSHQRDLESRAAVARARPANHCVSS